MEDIKNPGISPLLEDDKEETPINLSKEEKEHCAFIRGRLIDAKTRRDGKVWDEWDGQNYLQMYEANLKGANSFIRPKKNEDESTFVTGTTRQALLALVARVNSFNFSTEIVPYDKDDRAMAPLGQALEMVTRASKDADSDEAKRLLRFYELFAQGDVFVMQDWVEEFRVSKTRTKFDGKVTGVTWESRLKKVFEGCRRRVIPGRRLYLGSMTCDQIREQPYIFEWDKVSYAEAKAIFGTWERWKFVREGGRFDAGLEYDGQYMSHWTIDDAQGGQVEIVRYYDRFANEMQFFLNGTPMLPVGFPMPWEHEEYPVAQGWFEPIRPGFSYHNSIVRRLKNGQLQEDEIWRMLIILLQKSVFPPLTNMTGRHLTRRIMQPGRITFGLDPTRIKPLQDGAPGITSGMLEMANKVRGNMDDNSIPEIKQGKFGSDRNTATEVMLTQKEAEITMSLSVAAAQRMEEDLDSLMVSDVVQYALRPGYVKSTKTQAESGLFDAVVEVLAGSPEPMTEDERMKSSLDMLKSEHQGRVKVSRRMKVYADVKGIIARIAVRSVPRPRPSSAADKLALDQMFERAFNMFGQSIDIKYFQDAFAQVWNLNPDRAFKRDVAEMTGMELPGAESGVSEATKAMADASTGANAQPPTLSMPA